MYYIIDLLRNISFILFCFTVLSVIGYIIISKTLTDHNKIEEHKNDNI